MGKDRAGEGLESTTPTWESLEEFVRGRVQSLIQRVLEEEVTELLGREKSERREAVGIADPEQDVSHGREAEEGRHLMLFRGPVEGKPTPPFFPATHQPLRRHPGSCKVLLPQRDLEGQKGQLGSVQQPVRGASPGLGSQEFIQSLQDALRGSGLLADGPEPRQQG